MDNPKKCSHKKHKEKDAVSYCQECRKYLCNKCTNDHPDLFEDHHILDLKKDPLQDYANKIITTRN